MTPQRQVVPGQTWKRMQRVLIVDDDPTYRETLTALFTDWQWDVFEVSSGREALDILDRHAIDLVLLDVASQGVTCPDLLAAIRPQARELTIIGMGTMMTEKLRCDWRSHGVMECLTKPVTPQILSALLGALAPPSGFADS